MFVINGIFTYKHKKKFPRKLESVPMHRGGRDSATLIALHCGFDSLLMPCLVNLFL